MGSSRVVTPESKRLPLSNDDWILVRRRLSAGERHDSYEYMYLRNPDGSFALSPDGRLIVGPANGRIAVVLSYLLDWSLVGPNGSPLAIRGEPLDVIRATLRSIDEASFDEIATAITVHELALAAERDAQKKILSATPNAAPTSASPSAADGPSTTSDPST